MPSIRIHLVAVLALSTFLWSVPIRAKEPVPKSHPARASVKQPLTTEDPEVVEVIAGGISTIGLIVSADGEIVTTQEHLRPGVPVNVRFADGKAVSAQIVASDRPLNVALLRARRSGLRPSSFDTDSEFATGKTLWMVTSGRAKESRLVPRWGQVSSRVFPSRIEAASFIAIDLVGSEAAPTLGSPVRRDNAGPVVGLVTRIYTAGSELPSLAVLRAQALLAAIADLRQHGGVQRGWLGIEARALTSLESQLLMPGSNPRGVLLETVNAESPAGTAGLQAGDVVIAVGFNGKDTPWLLIDAPEPLEETARWNRPGSTLPLQVMRPQESSPTQKSVVLGALGSASSIPDLPVRFHTPSAAPAQRCSGFQVAMARVKYPDRALRLGIQGDVVLQFDFDDASQLVNTQVLRSPDPMLSRAAIEAVRGIQCPKGRYQLPFNFHLE